MGERQFPDPIYDGDFAALYGLPADTRIIGPPMSGTLLTKTPDGSNPMLSYDGPWPPPKKEATKAVEQPRPTAADPPPPELIPDDSKAIAVCLSPDVCKSPDKPVPYMSWGKASDDLNYSPDVRSNGMVIKRQDSKFSCCYGDEPGVGLGCKSGTVGDVVEPVTSSGIVRANGIWVQRHNDRCTLNNGNTEGEYVHIQSTDTKKAPDGNDKGDKAWYEKAWDWTGEKLHDAGQAIHEFDESHGRVITRGMGGLQAIGGAAESVAGAGLAGVGGAASATGVGAAPGVPAMIGGAALAVNGYDNFSTGLKQLWTGETQTTAIAQAAGQITTALGGSPQTAQTVENVVGMTQAVGGGAGTIAAGIGKAGTIAKTAKVGDDIVEEGANVGRAVESGEEGARSTRLSRWVRKDVNGRRVYQRDDLIDPNKVDDLGRTNKQRMEKGLAPLGDDGKEINLHHLTQDEPGAMAEVKSTFHSENDRVLHMYSNQYDKMYRDSAGNWHRYSSAPPSMDRGPFNQWKSDYWRTRAKDF
ncbi:DUF4150 domain-containing protein (plasmid) [Rhizobium sp. CB3060]|uniref:PAAR-like domain-containing protein n=1 Tax=Rhizobium sp. CB3060 TaxID=3138255 RepID=UPI0021A966A4|nr:PAAR-like domain-containing protein [Rhizobium tropici]UWU24828.1 DUF4150 domain-containing protein [Rhizobium tropici]